MQAFRKNYMKTFCLILLLASSPLFAQTYDPMSTMMELDATTKQIDTELNAKFEKRVSEYAKLSGMNEKATTECKIKAVMRTEALAQKRNLKDDMTVLMNAVAKKDCDELKRIAGLNHERAKKTVGNINQNS
jgi:Skp family chaperone for outer membrane proteins